MATWAKGIDFKNSANTARVGGIGVYGSDTSTSKIYLGLGTEPWSNNGLQITSSTIDFKGNKVYHAGDKPTLSELGAASSSHTHTTVGAYIGISNTTGTNGYGLSLYGGAVAGAPSYGIMFQQTGTFGTHGSVTGDWATYFTMAGATTRGWIFKTGNAAGGNVASISATGVITASSFSGALSGNASTATKLQTARAINGTNFDGSGAITTANWGTARTLTVGNSGKSVNGSANVSWSLSEIGAAPTVHEHGWSGSSTNTFIAYPSDGRWRHQTSQSTGYLKITLPQSWTSTMLRFEVDIYDYTTNGSVTYVVGGYNYSVSTTWQHSPFAYCMSNKDSNKNNLTVRLGHDGSKCAIYIGEASTVWSYSQVTIKNITAGYSNYAASQWNAGWGIGVTTTLGTITATITNTSVANGGAAASCTGNSATATTLQTTRTINGTNFNGSANITTANWGTARTITIGSTGKSVNGSANVSWSLAEIGAAPSSHTHSYLPLTGGTITSSSFGPLIIKRSGSTNAGSIQFANDNGTLGSIGMSSSPNGGLIRWNTDTSISYNILDTSNYKTHVTPANIGAAPSSHTHSYLPLTGGTMTGKITTSATTSTYLAGNQGGALVNSTASAGSYTMLYRYISTNGYFTTGGYQGKYLLQYTAKSTVDAGTNSVTKSVTLLDESGNASFPGTVSAGGFSGNASTATTLQTARTINGTSFNGSANITTANWGTARTLTIGSTGKSVNGSANVSWTLAEIGAAASSHDHNRITSRGTITCETGTTVPAVAGISMTQVYNNGYPTTYGNVISLRGGGHGQILVGWSGTSGAHDGLWVRSKRDTSDANWSGWARVYTEAYKPYHWGTGNPSNTDGKPDGTIYFKYV